MTELTKKQKNVLDAIKEFIKTNGYPPTRSEMASFFNYKSANAIECFFKSLQKKGHIKIIKGTARGIIVVDREV
ncbi:hypothetical protein [Gilliamella sp. Gris1-4]|jgi:repressor LexA|uniref:LexA family protein n=1 Tax=Gilliamella sp. Gris1-4 TaxID=3120244 RepID=UPI00080E463A|nr:hypothetical protein [Gilliamella apicola]OCG36229.1 hypothetical protein A9G31_00725 [Gilliamella apicola]